MHCSAIIAVQGWPENEKLSTRMIMQVHDELVLEVPESELERVKANVPGLMSGVARLDVHPICRHPQRVRQNRRRKDLGEQ